MDDVGFFQKSAMVSPKTNGINNSRIQTDGCVLVYSQAFNAFLESPAMGGKPHLADGTLQEQSLGVAQAYAKHLDGLRNSSGAMLKLECGFARDYGFNGAAGTYEGVHCCVLDVNLVGAMIDLAMTALSVPGVFSDVGMSENEKSARVTERDWPMGYALADAPGLDERKPIDRLTRPLDVTRRRCGVYLQLVALDLLWRHEISHALLGHVDFARDKLSLRALNERSTGGSTFDTLPLEVEADKHALLLCLETASQDSAPFLPSGLSLTRNQRYRSTVFAASLVIWFWAYLEKADRSQDPGYESGESHPPPGLRIMQLLTAVYEYFVRITRDPKGMAYVMDGVHDDLLALSQAHPRFRILNPELLYSDERRTASAAAHRIVTQRRDMQAADLDPYRYLER